MLGVATLLSFTSCEKDEVSETVIPPEDLVRIELVSKYATTGSVDFPVLTFYYELELVCQQNDIFLPAQENLEQISFSTSKNVSITAEDFIILDDQSRLEPINDLYHIKAGHKYQIVYILNSERIPQCMYESKVEDFVFQTAINGKRKTKQFPVDMGLRIFVQ